MPWSCPTLVVERPEGSGVFVRLNDSYLRSIAYIGVARPGSDTQIDATGTGFLVVHDGATYLVTAAHVAVAYQDAAMDVRLNRDDNTGGIQPIDTAKWYWHPDSKVDIAVMPFRVEPWARVIYFNTKHLAGDFKVQTKDLGTGDIAYVVGMFQELHGEERNVPVVHTGHIGSMGLEVVQVGDWRDGAKKGNKIGIQGFLISAPTLPGSSGSPVFVRRTLEVEGVEEVDAKTGKRVPIRAWTHGSVWLLGVWSAAWNEKQLGKTFVLGMGVCIPGERLFETLNQPELKELRDKAKAKKDKESKLSLQAKAKPAKV